MQRKTVIYRGHVQGVGFRWRVVRALEHLAVTGYVRNLPDGTVELVLEGRPEETRAATMRVEELLKEYIRDHLERVDDATGEFAAFGIRR
ncbi:MAG: acylphosphatase [Planctomycetota bacterium]